MDLAPWFSCELLVSSVSKHISPLSGMYGGLFLGKKGEQVGEVLLEFYQNDSRTGFSVLALFTVWYIILCYGAVLCTLEWLAASLVSIY